MAMIFLGKSPCRICGEILKQGDAIVAFPPGLFKPRTPLFVLNDAGVHASCILDWEFGSDALQRLAMFAAEEPDRELDL
jgi:hypothetical protein